MEPWKPFTRTQEKVLIVLALFGFMIPNGIFLYYAIAEPKLFFAAHTNPVAAVFILEALLLMVMFAWLIDRWNFRSPGWVVFILMSMVGSMAFSVPAFLYVTSRKARANSSRLDHVS